MPYERELIERLARRHGLTGEASLMPRGGMVNEAWTIGEAHVLRIVMEGGDAECDSEAEREAAVVPLVTAAGVVTPRLVAFGVADDLAPRPYTIYERAVGDLLGYRDEPIEHFAPAYEEVGRQTYLINTISVPDNVVALLRRDLEPNSSKWIARTLAAGAISQEEASQIQSVVDELIEAVGVLPPPCLTHCDQHPWNLMVDVDSGGLTAILDWGDATWGDPAREFAAFPFECFPHLFRGYQSAGGVIDRSFITRLLIQSVNCGLWEIRDQAMGSFHRRWWRMPRGGWPEMQERIHSLMAKF